MVVALMFELYQITSLVIGALFDRRGGAFLRQLAVAHPPSSTPAKPFSREVLGQLASRKQYNNSPQKLFFLVDAFGHSF